jgi:class 3 adenylate cyclase
MTPSPAGGTRFAEVPRLIAFWNFGRYTAQAGRLEDAEVARVMAGFYELAGSRIAAAGGRVVKFIGDGGLAVFHPEGAEAGVLALLDFKDAADRFMDEQGWECRLIVKIHYGTVVEGEYGAGADRRYDVLGKAVNIAARLQGSGVVLSEEAFERLRPEARRRFKKQATPPTYIRVDDPGQPRWAKGA